MKNERDCDRIKSQEDFVDWESLTLANDFLFGKVMGEKELCRRFLEYILGKQIDHIEYLETQKSLKVSLWQKGVRLDVYLKDDKGTVYNVEMQTVGQTYLEKRTRYYQSQIDMGLLEHGTPYSKLNESIIIFVCTFDPFNKNQWKYEFKNRETKYHDLVLEDGTTKMYINTIGDLSEVDPDVAAIMEFINTNTSTTAFTDDLDKAVQKAKDNTEWRREYMKWQADMLDAEIKGRAEGVKQGRAEGVKQGRAEGVKQGLYALVNSLKTFLPNVDQLYQAIIKNKEYEDVTREEIQQIMSKTA